MDSSATHIGANLNLRTQIFDRNMVHHLKSPESSSTREVVGEVSEMSRTDLEKFYNATFQNFNIKACTFLGRRCTVRLFFYF